MIDVFRTESESESLPCREYTSAGLDPNATWYAEDPPWFNMAFKRNWALFKIARYAKRPSVGKSVAALRPPIALKLEANVTSSTQVRPYFVLPVAATSHS